MEYTEKEKIVGDFAWDFFARFATLMGYIGYCCLALLLIGMIVIYIMSPIY